MKVRWVFNGCDNQKSSAKSYWQKKLPRLERLLSHFPPDQALLRLTLYRHGRDDDWELRGVLELPTATLVAEERQSNLLEVIDILADELAAEIKRHKDLLRKDHLYRRRRQQRESLSAAGPLLERDAAAERREAFFELLTPWLKDIRRHARGELTVLELEGVIPTGEFTAEDLVDDVLTRAWETYSSRPRQIPLDVWLGGLLQERLREALERREPELLSQPSQATPEVSPDEDPEERSHWVSSFFDEVEPPTLEELLPDHEADDAWYELTADEQRELIQKALATLPAEQRRAFTLHALEGFLPNEIAMLQERELAQVLADVEQARGLLRERLSTFESQQAGRGSE
jgi:DNA-directed RNA polymerase specialized sigma24 family protein/ribosome-associated translation inhibitor RaiA